MSQTPHHFDPAVKEVWKAIELARSSGASPDLTRTLETARELIRLREEYTVSNTSEVSEACQNILERTKTTDWNSLFDKGKTVWNLRPTMMTGPLEGQFLKSIVSIQRCKKILDIGMFTGYSALSMAEALPADGKLITLDQDEYLKELVGGELFKKSPHHKKIEIRIGKAIDAVKQMVANGEKFDLIFLDAEQKDYVEYLQYIFEHNLLSPRGTVLIDNSYIYGTGYDPSKDKSKREFINYLASKPALHKVLVPIRDGVMMVRRFSDVEGAV